MEALGRVDPTLFMCIHKEMEDIQTCEIER
ncbi:hypothetical protein SeMB42_g07454, partial [Synchytrium endobioticum]